MQKRKKKKEGWSFLCVLVVEQAVQVNMFILVEVGEEHLSVEVFSLLKKCRNKTQYWKTLGESQLDNAPPGQFLLQFYPSDEIRATELP